MPKNKLCYKKIVKFAKRWRPRPQTQ